MPLILNDQYTLEVDEYQFTLVENVQTTRPNAKKDKREKRTFHRTLEQVAREIVKREAKSFIKTDTICITELTELMESRTLRICKQLERITS